MKLESFSAATTESVPAAFVLRRGVVLSCFEAGHSHAPPPPAGHNREFRQASRHTQNVGCCGGLGLELHSIPHFALFLVCFTTAAAVLPVSTAKTKRRPAEDGVLA